MAKIKILDCTLRDGGHLVDGKFGESTIKHVINGLIRANVDIIEVGFLMEKAYTAEYARFKTIKDVKRILPDDKRDSKISLMADFVDLSDLEPCDGTVDYIRLSFKRFRLEWAIKEARKLIEKNYKVFINPVNCNVYSDKEYISVLEKVNELHPYGFSIVDTFGALRLRDLARLYYLVDTNLLSDIHIGIHLHENLGLAYSMAQHFISINQGKRDIVIDGSLLGMGRAPGNLCVEQLMDHLNSFYGKNYNTEAAFDVIDDCIAPIKNEISWGYSIPYALSAKYALHRTYGEFLMGKWKIHTSDIERILSMVKKEEAELFNEEYIEKLYREYISIEFDDKKMRENLKKIIEGREILVLAPGASITENKEKISSYQRTHNSMVIAIHFIPKFIESDLVFFTNIKRYEMERNQEKEKCMISSNLIRYSTTGGVAYVFDFSKLAYHNEVYSDDSTLMLLNLLKQIGVRKLAIAGFDGFDKSGRNFYKSEYKRKIDYKKITLSTKEILKKCYRDIEMEFITKSKYREGEAGSEKSI